MQGWATCQTDMLIHPESTEQLAAAIKDVKAQAAKMGRPLKMRAGRPEYGSMTSLPCPYQTTLVTPFTVKGKTPLVVGIMMDKMNKVMAEGVEGPLMIGCNLIHCSTVPYSRDRGNWLFQVCCCCLC